MAKPQCPHRLLASGKQTQCVGEEGHPGWHLFGDNVEMDETGRYWHFKIPGRPSTASEIVTANMRRGEQMNRDLNAKFDAAMVEVWGPLADRARDLCVLYGIDPDVVDPTSKMYDIADPLTSPLPPIAKNADQAAKDRQIEWVRANFTAGMLAKLYKLSYDVDGMRRDKVDEVIRKG